MKRLLPALALLVSACATYAPEPLTIGEGSLASPVAAVLEQRAGAIARPFLAPVNVDLSAPLDPDAVAALAVVNNPALVAQRARAGVSEAQAFAAGLLPDPTFSLGTNKVLVGPDKLLDIAAGLGFDLNALRTRAVRRAAAVAQARQVRLDLAWAEWQAAGQARLQAVRVGSLEQVVALAQASQRSSRSLLDRITRAATRGDIRGDRLQAARLAVYSANETGRITERDLTTARSELTRILGLPPGYALRLAAPSFLAPPPPNDVLFALATANRTDLAALRAGYAAQEAAVRRAILEQFPSLSLSLNSQRDSAGNLLVGPAIGFTLPLWNRNRGPIAVERATRAALRAEYDARLFQTRADIAAAQAGIALALRRRADALSGLSTIEHYAAASRNAAARGDLSRETAENAQQALRDRQIQLAQAEQDIAEQTIALELLTGTPRRAWPQ